MNGSELLRWRAIVGGICNLVVLALVLTPATSPAAAGDDFWSPPALTGEAGELPDGRDVIRRAIDFMDSHEQIAFEALVTYESLQENGQKLQFDMLQRVALRRPDRIHWVTLNDDATSETAWYRDGTFTLLKQPANLWGRVKVPPTLARAISTVSQEYNVVVPFVDLLSGDVGELWLGEEVEWVDYIAEAWAEGYWTDHVALRRPGVDVELWFRQGDEPFLVKMSFIHTDETGLPAFSARFRKWASEIPKDAIPKFVAPEGSEQVEIAPVIEP